MDGSQSYDRLDQLADEFAARFRRGERPTLKEYTDRYPELAGELRALLPALITVEQVQEIRAEREEAEHAPSPAPPLSRVGDYRILREIGRGGMGVVYEAEQVSLGRRVALKVLPWQIARDPTSHERFCREARASARLHHTNIVPVFEVGHDGEVHYYAMQFIQGQSLDSVIRELRKLRGRSRLERGGPAGPGGPEEGRLGDRGPRGIGTEAGLARSLLTGRFARDPTGIHAGDSPSPGPGDPAPSGSVPPAVGNTSAVMPGGTQLSSVESRHRAFHRGVAHIGRQVASALAYAHARGILHRDIKPSNLLLDTDGVVWVSDFGLAKVDDDALTKTGDILGTLRYMAPERFRGRGDARADVYSLGLTLFELLVLRPAFDSPDRLALSEQIQHAEPPRPRSLDSRIPRDLETIVLKAIEKDPGDRYVTAEAMAEDLRRFLGDEPIRARRAGAPERFARWARRHPAVAVLGGMLTAVLLAATIASVLAAQQMAALARRNEDAARSERGARLDAQAAQKQAEADRLEADRQRERAEQQVYIARIGQAEGALRLFDAATARGLLDRCRPGPGEPDRRGWEWSYLDQWCRPELRAIALPTAAQSRCVAVSPDGRLLAVGCWDPDAVNADRHLPVPAYLISLPDGRVRHELVGHNLLVRAVAFRPDGKRLATIGQEGTIRVWDTGSGRPLRTISVDSRDWPLEKWLSWSPDGRRLASYAEDGLVRIWDPETGRETARIAQKAQSMAWSPDGTRIALGLVGDLGLEVRPWDARTERLRGPVLKQRGWVHALCWSPDSRWLAAIWTVTDGGSPTLTVCDATSGERVFQVDNPAVLRSIAFSPDGTRVATGGEEEVVRVFDAADGRAHAALFTGAIQVTRLAFSPDGRRLHAAGWGMGGVKVFDPARDPRGRRVPVWPGQISALTFDREGLRILGIDWMFGLLTSADPVAGDVRRDRLLPVADSHHWPRGDFAFSPDGGRLAAPTRRDPAVIGIWDVALGRPVAALRGSGGPITAVAFGPDGRSLATAALGAAKARPIVTLWDLASGRATPIRTFEAGPNPVETLAFGADGRRLAAGGGARRQEDSGWVIAWDAETGAVLGALDRVGLVMSLAFHPDGVRLAVADYEESKVHLWDLAAGTRITQPGPGGVSCVEFTPDGKRLAALGSDGNVHLADARTGDEVLVLRTSGPPAGGAGFTPRLAFSPDGSRIVANAAGPVLNLWDLGPVSGLAAEPGAGDLAGWLRRGRALAERGDIEAAEAASFRGHATSRAAMRPPGSSRPRGSIVAATLHGHGTRWRGPWRPCPTTPGAGSTSAGSSRASAGPRSRRRCWPGPDPSASVGCPARFPDDGIRPGRDAPGCRRLPGLDHPPQPRCDLRAAGATLTRLPDGSVLAGGPNPSVDTYLIEATTDLPGITALRLETMTDPSPPVHGPGRNPGFESVVLDEIRLGAIIDRSTAIPVHLTRVRSDGFPSTRDALLDVKVAIDTDPLTGWLVDSLSIGPRRAVFQAARPIGQGPGTRLRVELVSGRASLAGCTLGRFRLSVTSRPFPFFEPSLRRVKADGERSGPTRLGAAYCLLGAWTSAADVLRRAAARPDASALDEFLLALAGHRLGRHDEARRDCDRGVARLGSELRDDATRDVAIEALMTVRSLSVDEAESFLLDVAFPADPFGPR